MQWSLIKPITSDKEWGSVGGKRRSEINSAIGTSGYYQTERRLSIFRREENMSHKVKIVRVPTQSTILVWVDDRAITPAESLKVREHSTDFEAGYGGSGPAQLALAIMLEVLSDKEAEKYYQRFKWKYIANPAYQEIGTHEFSFTTKDVKELQP
jgi:hypothetical protein